MTGAGTDAGPGGPGRRRHAEHVMGTVVSFDVPAQVGEPRADGPLGQAVRWLHWVDDTFSPYREDSDVSRFGRGALPLAPAPQQRHPGEHARLAGPRGGSAGRVAPVRRVPQVGQDVDTAGLQHRGLRVLILVDHVLVERRGHQCPGLGIHPGGDEGRQVEP